ncbi:amino acid adenylation domain-containing protein [Archangium gephyra]|uniref:amino acid adenylation domain-containing protein n=1 Tax=Archangium gephyra TaxID=48 RepID=UPI0035D48BB6
MHELFEAHAAQAPGALALLTPTQELSYGELNARANRLAHYLRELGVRPETRVGVALERSASMVLALLATLKAGGVYVPLDPAYPLERLSFLLEDAAPPVLLTSERWMDRIPATTARVLCLEELAEQLAARPGTNPEPTVHPGNAAYVIYTSGSLGRPKGVEVEHQSLLLFAEAQKQLLEPGEGMRVLHAYSPSFDAAFSELLQAWSLGAALCVLPPEEMLPGPALVRRLEEWRINVASFIPSVLSLMPEAALPHLRTIFVGGEVCPASLVTRWGAGRRFFNVYGPTEATVIATAFRCAPEGTPPLIGQPLPHVPAYLLDEALRPVPDGTPGELYLGGGAIARGYLRRPELTAERFVPDPFSSQAGARMYRTGDLGRRLPGGELDFLGRVDEQVKVRGFRVEPGEVEAVLAMHPGVRQAVVAACADETGLARLVAYVVPQEDATAAPTDWRSFLEARLPAHFVPSAFVVLSSLPRTANGKVDRKALPAPDKGRQESATPVRAPSTPLERELVRLFEQVLGVSPVGMEDEFFALGGHSLGLVALVNGVRASFGVELPLGPMFDSCTVATLAGRVEAALGQAATEPEPPLVPRPHLEGAPLSFAQQRFWFLQQLDAGGAAGVLPVVVRLLGALQPGLLARCLEELVRRHHILRTTYTLTPLGPRQHVGPPRSVPLPLTVLEEGREPERHGRLEALAREELARPFDLARDSMLRAQLVRLAPAEHVLLLASHHIALDGWSVDVLVRELVMLYDHLGQGGSEPLPEPPVQYADYALWQREWLSGDRLRRQLAFWTHALAGAPPVLHLPADRPRPPVQSFRGGQVELRLAPETVRRMDALAGQEGATRFMVLLAGFAAWLHRVTGEEDLVVGTPVANRSRGEISQVLGSFANTLALRIRARGEPTFRELLARVRECAVAGYEHQELPFERLVEELRPERSANHLPLVQVMLALETLPPELTTRDGLRVLPSDWDTGAASLDLIWKVWPEGEGLRGTLTYNADLFEPRTVRRMAEGLVAVLEAVATSPQRHLGELPVQPAGSEATSRLEELETALLSEPGVEDGAVRLREVEGRLEPIAYVVAPTAPARPLSPATSGPLAGVRRLAVRAIPLAPDGRVDEDALRAVPLIDAERVARWEELLREQPAVAEAAVVWHEPDGRTPLLHLGELLPDWGAEPRREGPEVACEVPANSRPERPPAFSDGGPAELPSGVPHTLTDALLRAAKGEHGIVHVRAPGSSVRQSYAALLEEARRLLTGLRAHGLGSGARVILQLEDSRDYLGAFWACVLGGITPVTVAVPPAYTPEQALVKKLHGVWALLGRPPILTTAALAGTLRQRQETLELDGLLALPVEELSGHPPAESIHPARPEDVAFLQLSSGSTGVPKCIQIRHVGVALHSWTSALRNGYSTRDVTLNWLPFDHVVPLLMYHLRSVWLGCEQFHVRTDSVLTEPLLWLELMEAHRVTESWSPNFGFKQLADAVARSPERTWDLSALRHLLNAGEQVTWPVVRELSERLAPSGVDTRVMQPAFGMAELCTVMTYVEGFDPAREVLHVRKSSLGGALELASGPGPDTLSLVALGRPSRGVQLRVVDANSQLLPEGTIGRLQVRGEVVTPGYLHNDAANREAFVGDGWFNTGDLGFLLDGALTITGREKELIIIRGVHHYCYEIEGLVESVEGVLPTFTAACSVEEPEQGTEGLALFFVPARPGLETEARLSAAIRTRVTATLGISPARVVPVSRQDFPKTTSGKIQRGALKRALAEGRFDRRLRELDLQLGNANTVPSWFHRWTWQRREAEGSLPSAGGRCLLFVDTQGLGTRVRAALERSGRRCHTVEPGERFERVAPGLYRLDPRDPSHYERLLSELDAEGMPLEDVLHLWGYGPLADAPSTGDALIRAQERGAGGLLLLGQALARRKGPLPRLFIASAHAQPTSDVEPIDPGRAPLAVLAQLLPRELPGLACRHIDFAPLAPEEDATRLLRELRTAPQEREVAYRSAGRLVPRLEPVIPSASPQETPTLMERGLYLLAGGLGGLGTVLARHLLTRHRARVLLLGRTPLAAKPSHAEAHAQLLATAASSGGAVMYEEGDVRDVASLRAAVGRAEARAGRALDGAFHLAGTFVARPLAEETVEGLAEVLGPKVLGAWALGQLVAEHPGAFLVHFTSVNGFLGGFSVAAYSAANRLQEHLAHEQRRAGLRVSALAWSGWDGLGMSQDNPMREGAKSRGFEPISADQGLRSLELVLRAGEARLLIGLNGRNRHLARHVRGSPPHALELSAFWVARPGAGPELGPLPEVRDALGTALPCRPQQVERLPRTAGGSVARDALATPGEPSAQRAWVPPRDEVESRIAELWRELLGVSSVSVTDNFFELGGHSMLVAQLRAGLEARFGWNVPTLALFRYPTIRALAAALAQDTRASRNERSGTPAPTRADAPSRPSNAVALVGMAGRFPGAPDVETLWHNVRAGLESITVLTDAQLEAAGVPPALRADPKYVRARGRMEGVELFDAAFFGYGPREAELMDPQHRLFLECAWEAFERAGYEPSRVPGAIGVFAGAGAPDYLVHHVTAHLDLEDVLGSLAAHLGNDKDHLTTRLAYKLNLRGPSITVQTACSTSLVAVQLACQSLLGFQCDLALAGGVSVRLPLDLGHLHTEGHIFSPDGHCRPFDARAQGTVPGDGVAAVVLKRLEDALRDGDHIHAVLLGAAVNNDGSAKVGYTAPGVEGQAEVVAKAHAHAGIDPSTIGYLEAHGTGTALGDPIELTALTEAFQRGTDRRGFCAIGSIKANVGHLNTAAGVTGLIKAALALEHQELPPSANFTEPNPRLDLAASPFYVPTTARPWPRGETPRRAGVSAFAMGGTNAHVVLEEAPARTSTPSARGRQLLVLSARTESALAHASSRLAEHLERHPEQALEDVAYTLAVGRRAFGMRRAVVCGTHGEAIQRLREPALPRGPARDVPVVFLFPGQGVQRAGMGEELYRAEPVFRKELDHCASLLQPVLGRDLREVLFRAGNPEAEAELERTGLAQPAVFAFEYALARLWMSWGIQPAAMIGHSLGEYVAACLAGVFTLEHALSLVCARGKLMQSLPPGAMTAVPLAERELQPWLGPELALAAVNGPASCVVSGPVSEVEALERRLEKAGLGFRRLRTSHAFHSAMMEPILAAYTEEVRRWPRSAPRIRLASNLTGTWLTAEEAADPAYWARHLRQTVRFGAGLDTLSSVPGAVLLEVGPDRTLSALAQARSGDARVVTSLGAPGAGRSEQERLLEALGALWCEGVEVDWSAYHAGEARLRVPLPTYPFERHRFWLERRPRVPASASPAAEEPLEKVEVALWERSGIRPLESYPGLEEGLHALCTSHLVHYLQMSGLELRPGARHSRESLLSRLRIRPAFSRLFDAMAASLVEDGVLKLEGNEVVVLRDVAALPTPSSARQALEPRFPQFTGMFDFVEHCLRSYPRSLTGELEAIGVLYPGGSPAFMQDCEARTAEYRSERVYNLLLTEAVRRLASAARGRRIRLLEIGGGQGKLTWPLAEALAAFDVEYHFTDLGKVFVEDARAEAARRGLQHMTFGVLDIGREPREQGYADGGFDIIAGFNVVHAVRDVRVALRHLERLLAPGGTLAMVEVGRTRRWDTLTWGLAEGWWYFDDGIREGAPTLPAGRWARLLESLGFTHVERYPAGDAAAADHALVLGRRPGSAVRVAPEPGRTVPLRLVSARHPRPELGTPYVAPRTALERRIATLCEELLGVERIGLHDNFFELGADSLITLRLSERLRRELGQEVPAGVAFQGSTVEKMARALERPRELEPGSPLVPLQTSGSRPPLYFVHPASGVVFPYVELARALGREQPFYGLQARGLDGLEPPDERVEDMARTYLKALRAVQPRGPYHLGGFSFGCLVAYEMAVQLAEANEEVGLVALVDEPAPLPGHRPSLLEFTRTLTASMRRTFWPHLHDYLYLVDASLRKQGQANPGLLPRLRAGLQRKHLGGWLHEFLAKSTMAEFVPEQEQLLALGQPAMLPMFQLFTLHARRTYDYQPRAYPHRVVLFSTEEVRRARGGREPTMGWRQLAAGGVDIQPVPGEHLSVLRRPHVEVLAQALSARLEQAAREREALRAMGRTGSRG